jgi:hypothetical protein
MTTSHRLVVAFTLAASTALPVAAQDLPMPIRIAVACGPQATTAPVPSDAPRIAGMQDTSPWTPARAAACSWASDFSCAAT